MNTTTTITISVTLDNETRLVKFHDGNGSNYYSDNIIAARIGMGEKLHRSHMTVWKYDSVDLAKKSGFSADRIFDIDGQIVALDMTAYVRNRQGRVVGWADKYSGTTVATNQNYYGSL